MSTAMARRLAEKRAARRHRMWRRLGIGLGSLIVVGCLTWVAAFSPLLALEATAVSITGAEALVDPAQVFAQAATQVGVPLPRVDVSAVRRDILAINTVREVQVSRAWPRGLTLTITPRQPAASIPLSDAVLLIDEEAVHLAQVEALAPDLPVIHAAADDAAAQLAALAIQRGLPVEVAAEVYRIDALSRDDVRTTLFSGRVIRWGSEERLPLKVAVLLTLLELDPGAWVFDVSSPDLPVTR